MFASRLAVVAPLLVVACASAPPPPPAGPVRERVTVVGTTDVRSASLARSAAQSRALSLLAWVRDGRPVPFVFQRAGASSRVELGGKAESLTGAETRYGLLPDGTTVATVEAWREPGESAALAGLTTRTETVRVEADKAADAHRVALHRAWRRLIEAAAGDGDGRVEGSLRVVRIDTKIEDRRVELTVTGLASVDARGPLDATTADGLEDEAAREHLVAHEWDAALELARAGLARRPGSDALLVARIRALEGKGDLSGAIGAARAASEAAPKDRDYVERWRDLAVKAKDEAARAEAEARLAGLPAR
jgi:hypothetical protein